MIYSIPDRRVPSYKDYKEFLSTFFRSHSRVFSVSIYSASQLDLFALEHPDLSPIMFGDLDGREGATSMRGLEDAVLDPQAVVEERHESIEVGPEPVVRLHAPEIVDDEPVTGSILILRGLLIEFLGEAFSAHTRSIKVVLTPYI